MVCGKIFFFFSHAEFAPERREVRHKEVVWIRGKGYIEKSNLRYALLKQLPLSFDFGVDFG